MSIIVPYPGTPGVLTCSAKSVTAITSPLPPHGPPSSAAPSPETPTVQVSSISGVQHRFCLSTIRTLKKLKDAAPFLKPVDPIALNIPHYPTVVKHPMDLGTIEQKLFSSKSNAPEPNVDKYYHVDQFIKDVRLVFENCYTFNGPDHAISAMAKRLEAVFNKQIKQIPPNEVRAGLFSWQMSDNETAQTLSCPKAHSPAATTPTTHYTFGRTGPSNQEGCTG